MLNPLLLLFLPLVIVPILLHLITLRRLRTIELSTYRFLMDSYVQQRRKIKLLEYLVMLLRVLFVLLLIFLLSRPVISRMDWLAGNEGGRKVILVVDTGLSMTARWGGTSSLQRAKATARTITDMLSSNDKVHIIEAGPIPREVLSRFASQKEVIAAAIEGLKPTIATSNIEAALELANNTQGSGKPLIYIISDFSEPAWKNISQSEQLEAINSEAQIALLDVGSQEPIDNTAVVGHAPENTNLVAGLPIKLKAEVVNGSHERSIDTVLSVTLDQEQVQQHNLSLQPGQRLSQDITITPTRAGVIRGRFEITGDEFAQDDSYLFTLNVQPPLRVLILSQHDSGAFADSDEMYLQAALKASQSDDQEDSSISSMQVRSMQPKAVRPPVLEETDVVILADIALDRVLGQMLTKYVEGGGGLMVLPGPNVSGETYNAHLLRVPGPISGGQATVSLGIPQGDPDDETTYLPVSAVDLGHPIFTAFSDTRESYFASTRIARSFRLTVQETDQPVQPRVLVRVGRGLPALVEFELGAGKVLVASFPASPTWTNLVRKPAFVPFMVRSMAYLRRPVQADVPSVVQPYNAAVVKVAGDWLDGQVEVSDPNGRRSPLQLAASGKEQVLSAAASDTSQKGYYDIQVTPPPGSNAAAVDLGFAVNLDVQDASLASMQQEQLTDMFTAHDPLYIRGSADDPLLVKQLKEKQEIWRLLIWIAFGVIGLEFFLSTLGPSKRKKAGGNVRTPGPTMKPAATPQMAMPSTATEKQQEVASK